MIKPYKPMQVFDENHHLYSSFIKFHTEKLDGPTRANLKNLLFVIHYGAFSMSKAWKDVERIRKEQKEEQQAQNNR